MVGVEKKTKPKKGSSMQIIQVFLDSDETRDVSFKCIIQSRAVHSIPSSTNFKK